MAEERTMSEAVADIIQRYESDGWRITAIASRNNPKYLMPLDGWHRYEPGNVVDVIVTLVSPNA